MRFRKDGTPSSLSRDAWSMAAGLQRDFADALDWLVDVSIAIRERGLSAELIRPPASVYSLMRIRMRVLVAQEQAEAQAGSSLDTIELDGLLVTLAKWANRERENAIESLLSAGRSRVGRPRKVGGRHAPKNALLALGEIGHDRPARVKFKPGRRLAIPISDDELLAQFGVARAAGPESERNQLQRIVREHLTRQGRNTASREQVTGLTKNLQRRLSEARRRRKSVP